MRHFSGPGAGSGMRRLSGRRGSGGSASPTLGTLTLSAAVATVGTVATISIIGATTGSTITGTVPDGMALGSAARAITGTPTTAGTYTFTLTETLAGAVGSPKGSDVSIAVAAAAPGYLSAAVAPYAAYGAQRIVSGYSGAIYRVRRDTDNAEMDVSCQAGGDYPDYSAIGSWAASAGVWITTIYDQSGHGRHLVQATAANQPRLDTAFKTGNCAPIVFDGYGRTANAHFTVLAKSLSVGSLGLSLTSATMFMAVAPMTSANDNSFFAATDDGFTAAVYEGFTQSSKLNSRSEATGSSVSNGGVRANATVLGFSTSPTITALYSRGVIRTLGATRTPAAMPRLTIGKQLYGTTGFNSANKLFALAVYDSALSTATDGPAVQNSLNVACGCPTSFDYTVVFDGDSIMEGTGSTKLRNMVNQLVLTRPAELFNYGIHGQKMDYATRTKYPLIYDSGARPNVFFQQAGTNDIGDGVTTGSGLYSAKTAPFITYLQGLGYKVVICTLLPRTGSSGWTGAMETERLAYNALVVANSGGADLVLDLAADSVMGPTSACADTSLYVDCLHPTSTGYARLATLYRDALETVLRTTALGESYVP